MKKKYISPKTRIAECEEDMHLLAGSYDVNLGVGDGSMDGGDARAKRQHYLEDDEYDE